MKEIRVGVINWDCSLPKETYFGYYQTRTLSPEKYRSITPYYADIAGENKIDYHRRSQQEFDCELSYAIKAGIDYFAYVFYPENGSKNHISLTYSDCSHRVYELNYARRMHEASELREKIAMVAIIGCHPFEESDIQELVELLEKPYYEKINGRPLVYIFNGIREDIIGRIRDACASADVISPFFAPMYNEACPEDANYAEADALTAYACLKSGIDRYSELCDEMILRNGERLNKCKYVIPLYTVGWDPSPRIDIPSPWVTYPGERYAKPASEDELLQGAKRLAEWIKSDAKDSFIGHILTFAWNEFEEGGWICPTYNKDLSVNTERIRTFSKISAYLKGALDSDSGVSN